MDYTIKDANPDGIEVKKSEDKDLDLQELLEQNNAQIKVIGCGGGGNNTINRITEVGIQGVETIALNTDAQDLLYTTADKKLLLGKELTKGLGAGADPNLGEKATRASEEDIKKIVKDADMVFITCGLGGGTGTGSAPVVAEIAKRMGCLVVGIVTMPFSMEGKRRYENAIRGLEKLGQNADTLIVIPNDKLLELAPDLPIDTAFKVADEILTNAVKGISELITRPGLINLDFADIKAIMKNGGIALIGVGESDAENRALEAVEKAMTNPLLDVDISTATGALVNVAGGPDMTLEEARKIVENVSERLGANSKIIWGAQVYEDLQNTVRATLIITGARSSQKFNNGRTMQDVQKDKFGKDIGVDFID